MKMETFGALEAGARHQLFVFWADGEAFTEAASSSFRASVARLREAHPYSGILLFAPGDGWRDTATALGVAFGPETETKERDARIRLELSRHGGIDHAIVRRLEAVAEERTRRLHDAKWGVFNHFLGNDCKTSAEWNAKVANFGVERIADQLQECGARFYFFTVMQGRRWMSAPSAAFDAIARTRPGEACSLRDLPMELADELGKRGIDLYLYFTGDGPYLDREIGPRFGLTERRFLGVTEKFVRNWASVLEELSSRYAGNVKGWWIDGCYNDHLGYTPELLRFYADAVKAGNPNALVAMNNGIFHTPAYRKYWPEEDFTAGEFNDFACIPEKRFIDGAQAFMLAPLAAWRSDGYCAWGGAGCKRNAGYMSRFVPLVNENGGVVCIDVRVHPDGSWDSDQMEVLTAVGKATGTLVTIPHRSLADFSA